MKGEIMPQLMQKPLFLDLKSLLWSGSQICCELIRVSLCSINHLQGHIEKRVHPDRPENPVATEERTTTIKNTLWKVMNRPSNTEVETDTPIWSLVCSTYQTKDHFTKIGIVLFNLGKKNKSYNKTETDITIYQSRKLSLRKGKWPFQDCTTRSCFELNLEASVVWIQKAHSWPLYRALILILVDS